MVVILPTSSDFTPVSGTLVQKVMLFAPGRASSIGLNSQTVWHKFNGFEKCYEMDNAELVKLRKAIYLYNSKHSKADHKLGVFVVCDDEVESLLSDYDSYLAEEEARRKREVDAY